MSTREELREKVAAKLQSGSIESYVWNDTSEYGDLPDEPIALPRGAPVTPTLPSPHLSPIAPSQPPRGHDDPWTKRTLLTPSVTVTPPPSSHPEDNVIPITHAQRARCRVMEEPGNVELPDALFTQIVLSRMGWVESHVLMCLCTIGLKLRSRQDTVSISLASITKWCGDRFDQRSTRRAVKSLLEKGWLVRIGEFSREANTPATYQIPLLKPYVTKRQ